MCSPARCSRCGRTPRTGRGLHAVALMANTHTRSDANALIGRADAPQAPTRGMW